MENDKIYLLNGTVIESKMLPIIFEDALEIVMYVLTVQSEVNEDSEDMMTTFFLDSWGTAFAECGSEWMKSKIVEKIKEQNLFETTSWNPGQHNVSLENQHAIFSLLKPEEIGVHLTETLMMIPQKTVSGFFAIRNVEDTRKLVDCDYCEKAQDCLSYHGNKNYQ